MPPKPDRPAPDQESVWDYPRPPLLEPTPRRLRGMFAGETIFDTTNAWRVLETSHPPGYYIPRADVRMDLLRPAGGGSFCEWKGGAAYFDLVVGDRVSAEAAWTYESPTERFAPIAGFLSFYAGRLDEAWVDDERAQPQPGGFYGGWITSDLAGPFKGVPGSWGW